MYYINSFFIYSILGFIMESTLYKFYDSTHHSGIFYGPITPVYGIGALIIIIIYKHFIDKLKIKTFLKALLSFIIFALILSTIEYIGGHLIHLIFNLDYWDYSHHKFHIGKYISLEMALIWGTFSLIFLYIIKPLFEKLIKKIPKLISYIMIFLFIIDIIATIITGSYNQK